MLYYNTVNDLLKNSLITLMNAPAFESFRLVGGTALSLQIGHRESIDIDLFSDADYGTINFEEIETFLKSTFHYVDSLNVSCTQNLKQRYLKNKIDFTFIFRFYGLKREITFGSLKA